MARKTPPIHDVSLRRFPHPYRAMLAISNDIDWTSISWLREVHRFMNTREETMLGPGLGLDIASSLWMYSHGNSVNEPFETAYYHDPEGRDVSDAGGELLHYCRSGWIDTLHSWGNYNAIGTDVFRRRHAENAIRLLEKHGVRMTVWVNHGDRCNWQNIGPMDYMKGDDPSSEAYHADLLRAHGVQFIWNHKNGGMLGADSLLKQSELRDGSQMWGFSRCTRIDDMLSSDEFQPDDDLPVKTAENGRNWLMVWHPAQLHLQLSPQRLRGLVEQSQFAIAAQHLGYFPFSPETVATLCRLRDEQDRGDILVARTARLLEYHRVHDFLKYGVSMNQRSGRRRIDIVSVEDPVSGTEVPRLEQLRGITFYTPDPRMTTIHLNGKPIRSGNLVRNESDGTGASIGIRWHAADTTDYTALVPRSGWAAALPWLGPVAPRPADGGGDIVKFLRWQKYRKPRRMEKAKFRKALDYAAGRYRIGLRHYEDVARAIGFIGRRRILDVGSGSGHWCVVFARLNGWVEGVEISEEFVEVARRVARHRQLDGQVKFQVGRAEDLGAIADGSCDAVCCHSVLMFTDHERALFEASRVLEPGGRLYVGYTTTGHRTEGMLDGFASGDLKKVATQARILLSHDTYRLGAYTTPGSRVRVFSEAELIALAGLAGLRVAGRPGVQDGRAACLGLPGTFDLLLERTPDSPHAPVPERAAEYIAAGAPNLAIRSLAEPGAGDEPSRRLLIRAHLKAGRTAEPAATALLADAAGLLAADPVLDALVLLEQKKLRPAVARLEQAAAAGFDARKLLASCLLYAGDPGGARGIFAALHRERPDDLGAWAGLAESLCGVEDRETLGRLLLDFVEGRAAAGADAAECGRWLPKLRADGPGKARN